MKHGMGIESLNRLAPSYSPSHDTERAELIAALVRLSVAHEQALQLADGLLDDTHRLLRVLRMPGMGTGRSDYERADARAAVARWRQELTAVRLRIASLLDQRPPQLCEIERIGLALFNASPNPPRTYRS
jgi:hypothetical protein